MRIRMTYDEVREACFAALRNKGLIPDDVSNFSKTNVIAINYIDEAEKLNQDLIEFEFVTQTFSEH